MRRRLIAIAVLLAAPASALAGPQRSVIGYSVEHRPIVVWRLGALDALRNVLIVGVIHGDETAGLRITGALLHVTPPPGVRLWVLPELNPDGVALGTRQNAAGVDLNREYPYRWERITDPVFRTGPAPASQPETRALIRLVRRIRPAVSVFYHQHLDLVDESGGDFGVVREYGRLAGLRAACLSPLPGVETAWSNHVLPGTTSFVAELPAGPVSRAALARHLRAVRALELGRRTGPAHRCDAVIPAA